jgi:photosystem II stability/assembly factor-like uncharacterized protein
LQFVNPRDGWCVREGAAMGSATVAVYRTRDGGHSWRKVSDNQPSASAATPPGVLPFECGKQITFTDPHTGWAGFGCNGGRTQPPLYRSTDSGAHWERVPVPAPAGVRIDGGSGFGSAVARGRQVAIPYSVWGPRGAAFVYSSADAGSTWSRVRLPDARTGWTVALGSPTRWYLLAGNRLRITDDGGRQWRTVRTDHRFGRLPVGALRITGDHDLSLFTLTAFWHTVDGGRHWIRLAPP